MESLEIHIFVIIKLGIRNDQLFFISVVCKVNFSILIGTLIIILIIPNCQSLAQTILNHSYVSSAGYSFNSVCFWIEELKLFRVRIIT